MKNYLNSLWLNQLNQNYPLSIPFYSGNGMIHNDFDVKDLFSGMYLIKTKLQSDIEEELYKFAELYKVDDYKMVIKKIEFIDFDNFTDSYVKVFVSYDILTESGQKVDSQRINLINYPKVQDNYTFRINGSFFSITDELINDYSLVFRDHGEFKEVNIRLGSGNSIQIRKYFDGSGVVLFKNYKKLVNAVPVDDINENDFEEYDISLKTDVINYFMVDIDMSSMTSTEVVATIFENLDNSDYFKEDDIRSKKIHSAYHVVKTILVENLKYIFSSTNRLKKTRLRRVTYSSFLSKLHGTPTLNFISDINPIAYLSSMRKLDLMGPNGPKASNLSMRDYRSSYLNVIDPLETPESGKLGLVIHRAVGCGYDESGKIYPVESMTENFKSLNFSALTIPFIHNNDSIRDSMAAGHTKQAVPIESNEVPYVSTGCDRVLDSVLNMKVLSPVDGEVLSTSKGCIKLIDGQGNTHTINCPTSELSNDKTMVHHTPRVKKGDKVYKGYELTKSTAYKDGYLTLGRNVMIAWMPYKGLNYEDSVVISESLAENLVSQKGYKLSFTYSDKLVDEEDLPLIGQEVAAGDVVLKFKKKVRGVALLDLYSEDYNYITYPKSGVVTDIITVDDSGNHVDSDWSKVIIKVAVSHKIQEGDKMSFSSAAKCIVSKILPDDQMPVTDDGEVVDIIHNTIGIPSRMNLSQLFEASLGYLNKLIREDILSNVSSKVELISIFNKINSVVNVENLSHFIEFMSRLDGSEFDKLLDNLKSQFVIEVKQFDNSITFNKITQLYEVLELSDKYNPHTGKQLYLPELGKKTKFPVFYGYARILVLKHIVAEKSSATSIKGLSDCREKSQKVGEMEILALEAHGASHFINELTLIRSNQSAKSKTLRGIIASNDPRGLLNIKAFKKLNTSYDEFKTFFRAVGMKVEEDK